MQPARGSSRTTPKKRKHEQKLWDLRFYVSNGGAKSLLALHNLESLLERHLERERYRLRVIDIVKDPELAVRDDIVAAPTLVRVSPGPRKMLIGTLAEAAAVVKALELPSEGENTSFI